MASPIKLSARRGFTALAWVLGLAVVGCSGKSSPTGPSQDPQDPPSHQPPVDHPPPPVQQPNQPPSGDQGITGVYVLTKINDSDAGQMVTLSKEPGGNVIGIYRFDPASELEVDALGTYTMHLRYKDEKGEYVLPDAGTVKWPGGNADVLNLTFESNTWGDSFTGMAAIGVISIQYDFDGDGQLDTVFGFERVGVVGG